MGRQLEGQGTGEVGGLQQAFEKMGKGRFEVPGSLSGAAGDLDDGIIPEKDPDEASGSGRGEEEAEAGPRPEGGIGDVNDGGDLELPKVKDPKFYQTEEGASWKVLDNIRFMQSQMGLVLHKRMFVVYNSTLRHTVVRNFLEMRDGESGETLQFKFPKEVFDRLPLNEPQFTYRRCAVVGNSGVVLLKEYGKEIDEHDAVFRLNMAPIRGFEDYVGSKTTFNMVNSHNIREMLAGQRRWRSTDPDSKLVVFETGQDFTRYHLLKELLKKFQKSNPVLLSPIFGNMCHAMWINIKSLVEKVKETNFNRKPMSGFFATMMAVQMCEHVNLYGFDAYVSKKHSYKYHYFDDVEGFTNRHSFDLAITVFKLIEKKGILTIKDSGVS